MVKRQKLSLKNCKKCYLFLMILGFVILITAISDKQQRIHANHLPWQIKVLKNGNTEVFGITLNQTSIRLASEELQSYPETALFEHKDGRRDVEAYFSSIALDGLTAKMILEYGISEEFKDKLIAGSLEKEGTPSGAFKYKLNEQDLLEIFDAPVVSISYIPYAQFDDEIILQRFGVAGETIKVNDHTSVLLYPNLGLSITYDTKGKELLQYVALNNFKRLRELALKAQQEAGQVTDKR